MPLGDGKTCWFPFDFDGQNSSNFLSLFIFPNPPAVYAAQSPWGFMSLLMATSHCTLLIYPSFNYKTIKTEYTIHTLNNDGEFKVYNVKKVYPLQKLYTTYSICMKFNKREHNGIFLLGVLLPKKGCEISLGDENFLYLNSEWQLHEYIHM